jgi:hypothetical protein
MLKRLLLALLFCAPAFAQGVLPGVNGSCSLPGQAVLTQGLASKGTQPIGDTTVSSGSGVIASYPSCLVTVYDAGTQNLATIYSDNANPPTALSNPFIANTDGSYLFFASGSGCYDISQGTGTGPTMPTQSILSHVCPGGSFAAVYTPSLPLPAPPAGALGLLYPPTGLKNFSMSNGANWFNTSPFDSDARLWGCDNTGATGVTACLDGMFKAVATTVGQTAHIPSGTYLIDAPLHISREMNISCDGGQYDRPPTTLLLGPGANIVFDSASISSDGGTAAWSTFRGCKVLGTILSCTATSGNGTLTSCSGNPSTALGLSANDYIVVMGFNGTAYWGLNVPQGTQVASTTANSITLAGGVLASASGAVNVMKSGYVATSGITSNGSPTISGVVAASNFQPGDPIQGPGIPYPAIVARTGIGTITMNVNAVAGAGAGNLTKGPLANVTLHAGSIVAEDLAIDECAGYCFDIQGSVNYSPATITDGQYPSRIRITRAGDACAHYKGADANTSTDQGFQSTYCSNGNIIDDSFLGNTHIGPQVANSSGPAYQGIGVNANNLWLNPYMEAGSKAGVFSGTNLILCGVNQTNFNGQNNGNFIGCSGELSPTFFWRNDQSGSTASGTLGSPSLTSVTNISQWHVGDAIVGSCLASTTLVSASDSVSVLTLNKNAICTASAMPITQTRTIGYNGTNTNSGNDVSGFGYSTNGSTEFDYLLGFVDPAYKSISTELGQFQWQYRGTANAFNFTTDAATASWDFNGTGNNYGYPVFPKGAIFGALANKIDIRANASAVAPTTLQWHRGSLALGTQGGLFQQTIAAKAGSGTTNITLGSTTLDSQNAAFLGTCAPFDSVTGLGIQNAVYLVDQNTLSKAATATTAALSVTCTRQPKAHAITACDTSTGTNTLLNCTTISGWLVNDTVRGTGIPTGTFVSIAPSGTTITLSQNATATNSAVAVTDAAFNPILQAGNTSNTGIQTKRAAGCATAASLAAVCTTTVAWPLSFSDTNYTVSCTGELITSGVPIGGGLTAKANGSVTFQTVAGTSAAAQYTSIGCTAVHD